MKDYIKTNLNNVAAEGKNTYVVYKIKDINKIDRERSDKQKKNETESERFERLFGWWECL